MAIPSARMRNSSLPCCGRARAMTKSANPARKTRGSNRFTRCAQVTGRFLRSSTLEYKMAARRRRRSIQRPAAAKGINSKSQSGSWKRNPIIRLPPGLWRGACGFCPMKIFALEKLSSTSSCRGPVSGEFDQVGRLQKIPQPLVRLAVEGVGLADFPQKFLGGLLGARIPVVRSM